MNKNRMLRYLLPVVFVVSGIAHSQVRSTRREEAKMEEHVEERNQYRLQQRALAEGGMPFGSLLHAKVQMDSMRFRTFAKSNKHQVDDAGISGWEWLGPGNIGGRIRAICVHPTQLSTMWIGSVSGGIWKTTNGGGWWEPVDDFMASLAVTSIVMDPTNSELMYASTGESFGNGDGLQGAGIFKSIDGGIHWSQLPSTNTPAFNSVNRLAHHPSLTGNLIAVTANGEVRRTSDGGLTWPVVFTSTLSGTQVVYHPNDGNKVLVGTQSDLYYSPDAGVNWYSQTIGAFGGLPNSPGRCEAAFAPNSSSCMYVSIDKDNGAVYRSTDGGASWQFRNGGPSVPYLATQGYYANAIWVSPLDSNLVVVGGLDLWRSFDGGSNWERISTWQDFPGSAHADQHAIHEEAGYDGAGRAYVYVCNDGGIQRIVDVKEPLGNGTSIMFENLAHNLGITQFYGGASSLDGYYIAGGAQDNGKVVHERFAGTDGWIEGDDLGDGGMAAIDYSTVVPPYIYGEYSFLQIKRSVDQGLTYDYKTTGIGDAGSRFTALFIAPFKMDPVDPATLIAGGASIWKTDDHAENWASIRGPYPSFQCGQNTCFPRCSAMDIGGQFFPDVYWVGYENGAIARTPDKGVTWVEINTAASLLPKRIVTDIAINPLYPNEAYVTFGGYFTDQVWYTSDTGATWQKRTGSGAGALPAIQVNTITINPKNLNWVYVGTDLGILASEDKGLTWSTMPNYTTPKNEGPVNVEVDDLFWETKQFLIAATHGRGMWRCNPLPIVFVDKSRAGWLYQDGTAGFPYENVQKAISAAGTGAQIVILSNTYDEANPIIFNRRGKVSSSLGPVIIK